MDLLSRATKAGSDGLLDKVAFFANLTYKYHIKTRNSTDILYVGNRFVSMATDTVFNSFVLFRTQRK